MPNQYYNYNNDFIAGTRVRSAEHDDEFAAIEAAFDLLGSPESLTGGSSIGGTDAGTVNNYSVTTTNNDTVTTPFDLMLVSFIPDNTNTGASTLAINGGAQYAITRNNGNPVQANDLIAGVPLILIFDNANSRWVHIGATAEQCLAENRPGVKEEAGTTYTLTSADESFIIEFTSNSAVTVTVPDDDTIPIGFIVHLYQDGTGQVTAQASGVTIKAGIGNKTRVQYGSITLVKVDTTEWRLVGDASA